MAKRFLFSLFNGSEQVYYSIYLQAFNHKMDLRQEILGLVFGCICVPLITGCISPQYAEVGQKGVVSCLIKGGNNNIYWRVNGSESSDPPIAYVSNGQKGGKGYESGDYDILPNGNLVIELVSYYHERTYEAIAIDSTDTSRSYYVDLKVTVTPSEKLPTVNNCVQDELCLVKHNVDTLQCVVGGARPPAKLSWLLLSISDNQLQLTTTNQTLIEEDSITFRTISSISLVPDKKNTAYISLYSCRVSYAPYDISYEKEVIIDWSPEEIINEITPKFEYFEINSHPKLVCSQRDKEAPYLWKKQSKSKFEVVAYRSPNFVNAINTGTYSINELGDLIIRNVNSNTEGNYTCISSSANDQQQIYQLIVVVTPSTKPAITVAECGAHGRHSCTIASLGSGELLCSVSDIRPVVSLDWSTDSRNHELTILSTDLSVSERSYLFTVTRAVHYQISHTAECGSTFSLICAASGPTVTFLDTKEACVTLVNEQRNCTNKNTEPPVDSSFWGLIILPIIIVLVVLLTALIVFRRRNQDGKRIHKLDAQDPEEMNPLQAICTGLQEDGIKEQFLRYLKIAYETKIPDRDLYVMNKFSQLNPERASSEDDRYIELSSYLDLFKKESLIRKQRLVLEGDAGCGKTSFAMCMAKEWLRGKRDSPMAEVEILIILSLIDFDGRTTIHDAIREQLIPHDCQHKFLSSDIERILANEDKKVVIFLDGFDEFIERNEKENKYSYLFRLIHNKVLSGAFVVILTRSVSYLRVYGDSVLPIVKLHSFTNSEINKYIGKKFTKDTEVELLQKKVKDNEHLRDICEIPFFLEMITRMVEETNVFEFANFSSMTLSFQELVNIKYRKLATDENAKYQPSWELANFAYHAITKNKSAWRKEHLSKYISEEELKTLLGLNMMKEIQQFSGPSQADKENNVVQFTHNIYKYYLGAHLLAGSCNQEINKYLKDIDPLTCQHLLVFTCGINPHAVESILEYVIELDDIFPYPLRDCVAMCINEAKIEMSGNLQALLKQQMTKAHGIDVLNRDRKSLKKAKAHVLKLCEIHKIPVAIMRFENIALSIENEAGIWDKQAQLHYSLPPVETILITDRYNKNTDSSVIFSILKNIPTVKEISVFCMSKPSSLNESDINVLASRSHRVLLSWTNDVPSETGIPGMEVRYPSLAFKRWMTYYEASVVVYMRKFKNSFSDLSEQEAVHIMAEKGIDGLFNEVRLNFIARKAFALQNEKLNRFFPDTVEILQKIDDAPRKEDILIYSKKLGELERQVRPYLVIYKMFSTKKQSCDQLSEGHLVKADVSGRRKMTNMPVFQTLKDIFLDVQV